MFINVSGHVLIPTDCLQLLAGNEGLQGKFSKYPKTSTSAPEVFLA